MSKARSWNWSSCNNSMYAGSWASFNMQQPACRRSRAISALLWKKTKKTELFFYWYININSKQLFTHFYHDYHSCRKLLKAAIPDHFYVIETWVVTLPAHHILPFSMRSPSCEIMVCSNRRVDLAEFMSLPFTPSSQFTIIFMACTWKIPETSIIFSNV